RQADLLQQRRRALPAHFERSDFVMVVQRVKNEHALDRLGSPPPMLTAALARRLVSWRSRVHAAGSVSSRRAASRRRWASWTALLACVRTSADRAHRYLQLRLSGIGGTKEVCPMPCRDAPRCPLGPARSTAHRPARDGRASTRVAAHRTLEHGDLGRGT